MMAATIQRFDFLNNIVRKVQDGTFAPAAFQRPYVWNRSDVEELWSSIILSDPLGGILLWRPEDPMDVSRFGRSRLGPITMKPSQGTSLILDGQNRLVTLAWSMHDPDTVADDAPGADVWKTRDDQILVADAVSDPESPRIAFMPRSQVGRMMLPIWKLFDDKAFNRHVLDATKGGELPGDARVMEWLDEVRRAAIETRIVISTIDGGDVAEAKRRFLRIARVGVPMSAEHFDEIVNSS